MIIASEQQIAAQEWPLAPGERSIEFHVEQPLAGEPDVDSVDHDAVVGARLGPRPHLGAGQQPLRRKAREPTPHLVVHACCCLAVGKVVEAERKSAGVGDERIVRRVVCVGAGALCVTSRIVSS